MVTDKYFVARQRSQPSQYAIAAAAVAAAAVARWALGPWAGDAFPLGLFYAAVCISVWYGGIGPAIFATIAGYGVADYFFIPPLNSLQIKSTEDMLGLLAYLFTCGVIMTFAHGTRTAEQRFRLSQDASVQGYSILAPVRDRNLRVVDFRWTYINPTGAKLLAHVPNEVIGQRLLDFLPQDKGVPGLFEAMREVADSGRPIDVEVHYDFPDLKGWFRNIIVKVGDEVAASFTDITERKTLQLALEHQAEELRQNDRRKTEFLAVLAHELRNPLAPIRTGLHLIKAADSEGRAAPYTSIIDRQVKHMVRLIEDLMDLSRIDTGKLEVRPEPADLITVVQAALDTVTPAIGQKEQELSVHLPSEPIPLSIDPVRMSQVFSNLLDNASKYTPKGGHIWLALERHEEHIEIEIGDDGRGIPADQLHSIFEPFFQVNRSIDRPAYGLGIGLTLVKRLVELHGGTVHVKSEGAGKGSRFTVCLPARIVTGWMPIAPRPASETPYTAPRSRVVVVDDNEDAANTLAGMLRNAGHEVHLAFDGAEAMERIEAVRPQAALVDIGLPKHSGYDVARAVRSQEWGRSMLLVAITGWGMREDKQKALDSGFDHHLTKPVDFFEIDRLLSTPRRGARAPMGEKARDAQALSGRRPAER